MTWFVPFRSLVIFLVHANFRRCDLCIYIGGKTSIFTAGYTQGVSVLPLQGVTKKREGYTDTSSFAYLLHEKPRPVLGLVGQKLPVNFPHFDVPNLFDDF